LRQNGLLYALPCALDDSRHVKNVDTATVQICDNRGGEFALNVAIFQAPSRPRKGATVKEVAAMS